MLKIWVDLWTALVRQLFLRQKLEALSNSQRNSLTGPEVVEVAQVDAEPVTVAPSSRSASSRKVAVDAEIIPNSNPNRRRPQGQAVLPPAIEVVDERDLRVNRTSLRSARKSGGQYPPTRLAAKDYKPLPPLPGTTPSNPNLLTVPSTHSRRASTNSRRPAAPQRISRASTINLRSSKVSGRLSTMAEEVVFRDVMKAVYGYAATADDELTMKEDQLLYLLGNLDDDWAKVQVHTPLDALSEAEPAAGLVPSAYIEPAAPLYRAYAVYDYEPNGAGEILMKENEKMSVYLKEDEWILVKIDRKGTVSKPAIGYVPANYVEEGEGDGAPAEEGVPAAQPPVPVPVPQTPATPSAQVDPAEKAAAAAAKLKGDPVDIWNVSEIDKKGKKKKGTLGVGNGSIFFASEADKAPVQQWQVSMVTSVSVNDDKHKHVNLEISSPNGDVSLEFGAGSRDEANAIVEKVERSKRLAVGGSSPPPKSPEAVANTSTVGIKSPTPSAPAPNGNRFLPPPGHHPGLSPSPSGKSKGVRWDTAPPAEIPQAIQSDEESEGPMAAAPPPSAGATVAIAMYDFEADGDDELTVKEGEKLTVLDKEESEEWWKCRNSKGKEGVVPSSYLEIESADEADDGAAAAAAEAARAEAARKEREQAAAAAAKAKRVADERRKREQEAREAQERQEREEAEAREAEAQQQKEEQERRAREARRREAESQAQTNSKSSTNGTPKNSHNRGQSKELPGKPNLEKPKPTNTRIWHDRSGQFKVEAQFLGIHNHKVRLHKANGVIIEVPEEKMSATDMDYIRKSKQNPTSPTSPSADDDVPLGTLAKSRPTSTQGPSSSRPQAPLQRKSHIDWFEFFLNSGCDIDDCTRYASSFEREKIDEAILPDLKHDTLRGLGLREGDIIRVVKQIEQRGWKVDPPRSSDPKVQEQMKKDAELAARLQEEEFGRKTPVRNNTASPGLFTGPGGALRNNTRRGRPTPTKAATLTVDASGIASASEQLSRTSTPANVSSPTTATASSGKPATSPPAVSGFDDDAWTPRPASAASKPAPTLTAAVSSAPAPVATPTPPPPPPAAPVQLAAPQPPAQPVAQPATTPAAPAPPAQPAAAPKLATEFDVLARIGTMRPPSAPAPPATAPLPSTFSPPPSGFQQGMGMGSSPAPMGSLLQAQATGALSPLQALGGARAPYAPVPQNEGLLKPLIPTTTGFNSFVPTRPGTAPATSLPTAGATPSFLTSQPTGFNPSFGQAPQPSQPTGFNPSFGQAPQPSISPLLSNPTGFAPSPSPFEPPSTTSSGFSTSSYLSANSTFSPIAAQPTGFGNVGAGSGFGSQFGGTNPGSSFLSAVSSQPTGMYTGPPNVNPPPDNNSPANVFAAMKAGSFANNAAPQASDRYDALRPQPTGWNALSSGVQPQPTGFNPGFGTGLQPGATFGQPGFQQPMQTGFGQPGFGGAPNQFGGFQR